MPETTWENPVDPENNEAWWRAEHAEYLPKSGLGKAFPYARNQERPLRHALHPDTRSIDNNRMERGIRSFAVGRNNWMFSRTPRGARVSAAVYSLIETAKANGLHPEAYLTYLMDRLPNRPSMEADGLEAYLPWSDSLPDSLRQNYQGTGSYRKLPVR